MATGAADGPPPRGGDHQATGPSRVLRSSSGGRPCLSAQPPYLEQGNARHERLGCQISRHHVRSFRVVGDVFIHDSSVLAECNFIWRAHHPLFFGALDEASTAFDKGTADNDEVRGMCDKEIALFNELGVVHRKGQREMVTLVPHAAILMWILCRKSILRRPQDTGPWYAATLAHVVPMFDKTRDFGPICVVGAAGVEPATSRL